jgi:hypothetical protein
MTQGILGLVSRADVFLLFLEFNQFYPRHSVTPHPGKLWIHMQYMYVSAL